MTMTQTLIIAAALLAAGVGFGNAQATSADEYKIAPISGPGSLVWIIGSDGELWFCGAQSNLEIHCGASHRLQ